MSNDSAFLFYALLFRFGIIGAGCFTIFLGYSLFRGGHRGRITHADTRSTAEASLSGLRIRLQNVTAGSIFALFGAVLIVAMIWQGNPEKTHQSLIGPGVRSENETLRGGGKDSALVAVLAGKAALERGSTDDAERLYRAALLETAPALNALAWIYTTKGKAKEAQSFARSAVQLDNTNAHYLDTLADVESAVGDRAAALNAIEKAAQLDPVFKTKFERLRKSSNR